MTVNQFDFNNFRYEIAPLPDHQLFWVTFEGELTLGRLNKAHEIFKEDPDFTAGVDELLDFSFSSLAWLSPADIQNMRLNLQQQPERHHCKSAIIVNTKLEFGLMRMMGSTMDIDVPTNRGVFYSLDEALEWLRPGNGEEVKLAHARARGNN